MSDDRNDVNANSDRIYELREKIDRLEERVLQLESCKASEKNSDN